MTERYETSSFRNPWSLSQLPMMMTMMTMK